MNKRKQMKQIHWKLRWLNTENPLWTVLFFGSVADYRLR
jgi:hypothetical protein